MSRCDMPDIRFFNTYEPVFSFYRDLLPFLAEHGLTTEVVMSSLEYRAARQPLEEKLRHPAIGVRRVPVGRGLVRGRVSKLWAMLSYVVGGAGYSLFAPPSRVNVFLTQPPLFALWGLVLRIVRRQPYCCLVMDLYPDVAICDGFLAPNGWLARGLTRLSRFVLRRADSVIVIGRCMQDRLAGEGVSRNRLKLVNNWINEAEVYAIPHERNMLRKDWGLVGKFVILYSGNLGVSHYLDDILETARRLRSVPDLVFLFIGDGPRRREVIEWKERFSLNNIRLEPFQPVERLAESLSLGDLHFISLRAGFSGLVVPSKAYGALGAGRPMIYQGEASGETARMIVEETVGTVVPLGRVDLLTQTIRRYEEDRSLAAIEGERALAVTGEKYSRERALWRYLSIFEEFLPVHTN